MSFWLEALLACAGVSVVGLAIVHASLVLGRRGHAPDGAPRANPDLQLILDRMDRERADFRADLQGTTEFCLSTVREQRGESEKTRALLVQLVDDARNQSNTMLAALLANRAPPATPAAGDEPPEVMDDLREAQIEELRAGGHVGPDGAPLDERGQQLVNNLIADALQQRRAAAGGR